MNLNEQRYLTLSLDRQLLCAFPEERELDRTVASALRFREQVESRGSRFIFAPLYGSGGIYPELFPEQDRARLLTPTFIERVISRLETRGVVCLDVRAHLVAQKQPFLFLRDDTHYNARGMGSSPRRWPAGFSPC